MVVRRNDTSRTKHLSNNRMPSETYLKDEEGAKLLVLTDWLKNNVGALFVQIKKLETTVECIENYVEEKTGVEPGKEISSDSDSSDSDYEYEPCEAPTSSEKNICKVKCVKKKSGNKKAKPRRNPARAVKNDIITNAGNLNKFGFSFFPNNAHRYSVPLVVHSSATPIEVLPTKKCKDSFKLISAVPKVRMESERQAERIPERPSEKDLSNNLPSDLEELTKVFEKNLEGLENLVKLFKSDVSKMFDISDPNFPGNSINANPEK
ncbi:unnamed protein product [Rhizophagus irregularis]|nr:unnamed protein product [Rhizophagus irregularis]